MTPNRAPFWTEERTAILRERYAELGAPALAKLLGSTPRAVQSKCSELGIKGDRKASQARRRKQQPVERHPAKQNVSGLMRKPKPAPGLVGEARITSATKVTICPSGADTRYRVESAPRVVDSAECRDWARAVA